MMSPLNEKILQRKLIEVCTRERDREKKRLISYICSWRDDGLLLIYVSGWNLTLILI